MRKTAKQILGFLVVILMAVPFVARGEQPHRGVPGTHPLNPKGEGPTLIPSLCVAKHISFTADPIIYRSVSKGMLVRREFAGVVEEWPLQAAINDGWVICRSRKDECIGVVAEVRVQGNLSLIIPEGEDASIFASSDDERGFIEPLARLRIPPAPKDWPADIAHEVINRDWQEKQWRTIRDAQEQSVLKRLGATVSVSPEAKQVTVNDKYVLVPKDPTSEQLTLAEFVSGIEDREAARAIVMASRNGGNITIAQLRAAKALVTAKTASPATVVEDEKMLRPFVIAIGVDATMAQPRKLLLIDGSNADAKAIGAAADAVNDLDGEPAAVISLGLKGEKERRAALVGDFGPNRIVIHRPSLDIGLLPHVADKAAREEFIDNYLRFLLRRNLERMLDDRPAFRSQVILLDRAFLPQLKDAIVTGQFRRTHVHAISCPIEEGDALTIAKLMIDPEIGGALSFSITAGKKEHRLSAVTALSIVTHLATTNTVPRSGELRPDFIHRCFQQIRSKFDFLPEFLRKKLPAPLENDQNDADRAAAKTRTYVFIHHSRSQNIAPPVPTSVEATPASA